MVVKLLISMALDYGLVPVGEENAVSDAIAYNMKAAT